MIAAMTCLAQAGLDPTLLTATDQRVIFSIDAIGAALSNMGKARPLVVIDRAALAAAGLDHARTAALFEGLDPFFFDAFTPNPRCEEALAAASAAAHHAADAVVAIGGGSCSDVAKVAALAARSPCHAESLARGETSHLAAADPLPLIVAPTTSGTGSEATHFAAIYVDHRKVSVAHPRLRPAVAALDLRLHLAMPRRVAATTGLDALGQSLESLWAVAATDASRAAASAAGTLAARWLVESVVAASTEARRGMMLAAHLAGRAINISKTTTSHALSYQFTERYGIPHGHAVALTLGHLAAANAAITEEDCLTPWPIEQVRRHVADAAALLHTVPGNLPATIAALLDDLGLPTCLDDAGVPPADLADLAHAVDPIRSANNPRRLTRDDLLGLLHAARHDPRRALRTPA